MSASKVHIFPLIGWREWVTFPDFGDCRVKAKVDTGARTSAIHAFDIVPTQRNNRDFVSFSLHPNQNDDETIVPCIAPLIERRVIRDSGGHEEERFVVDVTINLGDKSWPIELSLTDRDAMGFRMLLGRAAIKKRYLVVPGRSYLGGNSLVAIKNHP